MPPQEGINGLYPRLGKLVEVGWVYTVIAGLLNILAIYDAYEGPAYADEPEEPAQADAPVAVAKVDGLKPGGVA